MGNFGLKNETANGDGMTPQEIKKLNTFFKRTFQATHIEVRKRSNKDDSAEVYMGEDFIGVVFRDEEDGELSYNFQMAILDIDLDS